MTGRSRARASAVVALLAVVAAVIVPLLWLVLTRTDRSIGDLALIELGTRDVLSANPPLVGPYSRYGWSHPGPLMFYVLALPYRLFGNDADALRLAVLAFNAGVVVTIGWLLLRRGKAAFVVGLAATVALAWGMLPHSLSDGWNVTAAMLPFFLAVVACWCSWCGDRGALLIAALATSWVVQAHVGFGVVLAPLFLVTLGRRVVEHRSSGRTLSGRQWTAVAVALAVTVLAGLVDLVTDFPGNVARLARWSLTNDEPSVGVIDAFRIIGRSSSLSFLPHPRFPGRFLLTIDEISTGVVPGLTLVLLAVAFVVSRRHGWAAERALCGCLAIVWTSAVLACATITRPLAAWLLDWLQPLGWLTWAAIALVGWRTLQPRIPLAPHRVDAATATVALVVLVSGTAVYSRAAADTPYLLAADRDAVEQLSAAAIAAAGEGPIRIEYAGDPITAGTMLSGVVNLMDRDGVAVCVLLEPTRQHGQHRICAGRPDVHLLIRAEPLADIAPAGAITLAISDPLNQQERTEADRLTLELAEILVTEGLDDRIPLLSSPLADVILDDPAVGQLLADRASDVRRLHALRERPGTRFALYLVPSN